MTTPTEIPNAYSKLTQDDVTRNVKAMFARYWEAEDAADNMQAVADHVQEAADAADRHKHELERHTQELCNAIREHRPDLTIPEP